MGGVDRSNRAVQAYSRKRWSRTHNWHRIFFHLLDLAVTNAFVLYNCHRSELPKNQKMSLKKFKKRLADQLVKNQKLFELCRKQGRREVQTIDNSHPFRYSNIFHQLGFENTKRNKCWYCYNVCNNQRKDTFFSCKTCKVPLCVGKKWLNKFYKIKNNKNNFYKGERDCFNKFHSK